ncbi:MAG: beta-ketoacyl-[acyl-carrier-protein] synthase family protein [Acidobacteriota bacterium]
MNSAATHAEVDTATPAVAVTGLGAVSAWGWTVESLWRGLLDGRPAIDTPRRFDTSTHRSRLASEVPGAPADVVERLAGAGTTQARRTAWRRASRADRFALAAADEAWRHAGLEDPTSNRATDSATAPLVGVFFASSTAAMDEGEHFFQALIAGRRPDLRPVVTHPLNGPGDTVARHLRVDGPVLTLSSACASGGLAIGAAVDALRDGEVDIAIAGGADSLCHLTYAGFNALRAIDLGRCRPFRDERAGLNLGEGAGVLILERVDDAEAREARVLARVLGHGASCDAHHMTAPHPEGAGAARAIAAALTDGAVMPHDVAFVNAHGTGTPHNDIAEARALHAALPEAGRTPVTSTKSLLGHFLGSSGSIEAVATVLALDRGILHATAGEGTLDPRIDLDLVVGAPRAVASGPAVSTSFAFGGSNAAVLFGA